MWGHITWHTRVGGTAVPLRSIGLTELEDVTSSEKHKQAGRHLCARIAMVTPNDLWHIFWGF